MQLPRKLTSKHCLDLAKPGEQLIAIVMDGQGGSQFQFQGSGSRTYIFQDFGNRRLEFRIPISVWQANKHELAKEIFSQSTPSLVLIPEIIDQ